MHREFSFNCLAFLRTCFQLVNSKNLFFFMKMVVDSKKAVPFS